MRRFVLLAVTTVLLLGGCNSASDDNHKYNDGGTDSATPSAAPSGPSCDDIWQAGNILPKDYTSCLQDGAAIEQEVTKCKDGTKLVAYSDAYFAITGGKISKPKVAPMQDTEEFGKAFTACTGE